MKSVIVLGIVALVLGSLGTMLAAFPSAAAPATESAVSSEQFSPELAKETADRFNSMYGAVVSDIASYVEDPDLERAERRRVEMLAYSDTVSGSMEKLATTLQDLFDDLVQLLPATEPTTASASQS